MARPRKTETTQSLQAEVAVAQPKKQTAEVIENDYSEFYDSNGEFIWEAYQATCVTHTRTPNPHVKTSNPKDIVFCREPYAQQLYDIMSGAPSMQNFKSELETGEIYEGTVYGVSSEWITVDVNYREMVYVKTAKEPIEFRALAPGEEVAVLITGAEDAGQIIGTISGGMKQKVFADLRDGVESGDTAWIGKVENMIENGGYAVSVQGIRCFMPGSLAGINKLHDFNSIVGQEIYVVPVSFSPDRGTIVVSHRKYLQAMIPTEIQNLKSDIEAMQTGSVTGTAKYGVFVEFNNCLTGMIHSNDLDEETMIKFKKREIKPGDSVNFWVKEIVTNSKITLTQKMESIVDPWNDFTSRYNVPCNVTATVKAIKDYGMFITIEEGIVGLLHISEVGEDVMSLYKAGEEITVQVNRIETETKKVFLKLPS